MRFWDASAVVPLLVLEQQSDRMDTILAQDRTMVVWWGTVVECTSALLRQRRDGGLDPRGLTAATGRLRRLAASWIEVQPGDHVREHAMRLLRIHRLRAGDALQLAAALSAADSRPDTIELVTLDARQAEAAEREGFRVVG